MSASVLEVGLFVLIGLVLLAPLLCGAVAGGGGRSAAERDEARRRWAGRVGGLLLAVAVLNFLAFAVHASLLGGSADSSKQAVGRFYVSSHGRFTEVTEREWRAVRAHKTAVFVTHPLGLLVGGALLAYSRR